MPGRQTHLIRVPRVHNHSLRARISRLGLDLIDGPFSIRPPAETDDYGWLECDLRLVIRSRADGNPESVSVYVDDSANREEGFIRPLIRHAIWHDMAGDLRRAAAGEQLWPGVAVTIGHFDRAEDVDVIIRELQGRLCAPPFAVMGLVPDRAIPEIECDHDRGRMRLYSRNGVQSLEYESPALQNDGGFTDAFFAAFSALRGAIQPLEADGWSESYQYDPDDLPDGGAFWRWDYRAGSLCV